MTTVELSLAEAAERMRRLREKHESKTKQILLNHGARIEAKAAVLTPVDKGFLRRANTSRVKVYPDAIELIIENRMIYARYQHDYPHHHFQPQARDHFISIPFAAELPAIVSDIVDADIQEATS